MLYRRQNLNLKFIQILSLFPERAAACARDLGRGIAFMVMFPSVQYFIVDGVCTHTHGHPRNTRAHTPSHTILESKYGSPQTEHRAQGL